MPDTTLYIHVDDDEHSFTLHNVVPDDLDIGAVRVEYDGRLYHLTEHHDDLPAGFVYDDDGINDDDPRLQHDGVRALIDKLGGRSHDASAAAVDDNHDATRVDDDTLRLVVDYVIHTARAYRGTTTLDPLNDAADALIAHVAALRAAPRDEVT